MFEDSALPSVCLGAKRHAAEAARSLSLLLIRQWRSRPSAPRSQAPLPSKSPLRSGPESRPACRSWLSGRFSGQQQLRAWPRVCRRWRGAMLRVFDLVRLFPPAHRVQDYRPACVETPLDHPPAAGARPLDPPFGRRQARPRRSQAFDLAPGSARFYTGSRSVPAGGQAARAALGRAAGRRPLRCPAVTGVASQAALGEAHISSGARRGGARPLLPPQPALRCPRSRWQSASLQLRTTGPL